MDDPEDHGDDQGDQEDQEQEPGDRRGRPGDPREPEAARDQARPLVDLIPRLAAIAADDSRNDRVRRAVERRRDGELRLALLAACGADGSRRLRPRAAVLAALGFGEWVRAAIVAAPEQGSAASGRLAEVGSPEPLTSHHERAAAPL